MDYADYHVVYVDNRVSRDLDGKLVQNSESSRSDGEKHYGEDSWEDQNPECLKAILGEIEEVRSNLKSLLSVFNGGTSLYPLRSAEDGLGMRDQDSYHFPEVAENNTMQCTPVFPAILAWPKFHISNLSVLISNLYLSCWVRRPMMGKKAVWARFGKNLRPQALQTATVSLFYSTSQPRF